MSKWQTAWVAIFAAMGVWLPAAQAQFHQQGKTTGSAAINQQAVQQARMQSSASHSRVGVASSQAGAAYSGGDMILPDGKREALKDWNPRIGQMVGKNAEIWGRAIHHSDGTFTESKQDNLSNTLEQETKSKNGVTLRRRMIMLDQAGRPAEVMIYDGNDQFKYRGVLLYDVLGRFSEEQVYDPQGTLIRRKVQEYTPQGLKLPLRAWDYVENVPTDLRLVISEDPVPEERQAGRGETEAKRGLFGQPKGQSSTTSSTPSGQAQAQPTAAGEQAAEKRKGLGLGRLFGKKD